MKQTLLFIFLIMSILLKSQNIDTIFTNNKSIPCKITLINPSNVFYIISDQIFNISTEKIQRFSINENFDGTVLINDTTIINAIFNGEIISGKFTNYNKNTNITLNKIDSSIVFSQSDSINIIFNELIALKSNFNSFYKEYKTGTLLLFSGLIVGAVGIPIAFTSRSNASYIITTTGGVLSIIGVILQIDAHKYLGRASLTPTINGISFKYKL